MTPLLPILPVLLLAVACSIACFWSLRKIDRFLADSSQPEGAEQFPAGTEPHIRFPR